MTQVTPIRDLKGYLEPEQVEKVIAAAANGCSAEQTPHLLPERPGQATRDGLPLGRPAG